MSHRPNILLIVMDQFRGDLLTDSPLGRVAQLPNMRALMGEAVTFQNHYSVVAPCGPSRASLWTGQYAMNHRSVRNGTPLRHDTPTLPKALRAAGIVPELFGYSDTAQDPRVLEADDPRLQTYEELMDGFEETLRMRMESDDQPWRDHLAAKGKPVPPYPDTYLPDGDHIAAPAVYAAEDSDTAYLTDQFMQKMEGKPQGWFATLNYVRPHPPLVAPEPYNTMYDPADMPAPMTTKSQKGDRAWHPYLASAQDRQKPSSMVEGFPDLPISDQTTAALRALYLGLCSELDHHIGRLSAWLKDTGQWDDTIFILTSDHGEMLGDFGQWGKWSFNDASFHVPLIIRDPASTRMHGSETSKMTESVDLAVTLLERLDAEIPHTMNGKSLLPLIDDLSAVHREHSFSEQDFGNPVKQTLWMQQFKLRSDEANYAVLRTERYRLVQFGCEMPPVLFDMKNDGEALDVSDKPENLSILLDLTRKMLCHRMVNPDATFANTVVGGGGVQTGTY
ncbi:MAG: sulfatase-like hydrolase/transferase [Pseudomonadota bacterium]